MCFLHASAALQTAGAHREQGLAYVLWVGKASICLGLSQRGPQLTRACGFQGRPASLTQAQEGRATKAAPRSLMRQHARPPGRRASGHPHVRALEKRARCTVVLITSSCLSCCLKRSTRACSWWMLRSFCASTASSAST